MKIIYLLISFFLFACQSMPQQKLVLPENPINEEQNKQLIQMQSNIKYLKERIFILEKKYTDLTQSVRVLAGTTQIVPTHSSKNLFELASINYAQGNYLKSIQHLNEFLIQHIDDSLKENSLWLLAQSHLQLAHHESAIMIANQLIQTFPKSTYSPDALLLIAQCRLQMQQKDIARETLRKIIQRYPQHKTANQARNLLK